MTRKANGVRAALIVGAAFVALMSWLAAREPDTGVKENTDQHAAEEGAPSAVPLPGGEGIHHTTTPGTPQVSQPPEHGGDGPVNEGSDVDVDMPLSWDGTERRNIGPDLDVDDISYVVENGVRQNIGPSMDVNDSFTNDLSIEPDAAEPGVQNVGDNAIDAGAEWTSQASTEELD